MYSLVKCCLILFFLEFHHFKLFLDHDIYLHFTSFSYSDTICGKYEKKLLRHLMVDYDDMERPVENETEPLMLTFGVTLQQIIDVVIN